MLTVAELLDQLDAREREQLRSALREGIHQARLAALCLEDDEEEENDILALLTRLSAAIERLGTAPAIAQRYA